MGSQEQWGRQGEVPILYFVTVENVAGTHVAAEGGCLGLERGEP